MRVRVAGEGGVTARGHQRKGSKSRVTLGHLSDGSIEGARALANTYLDQANKGVSPIAALGARRNRRRAHGGALAEKFLSRLRADEGAARAPEIRRGDSCPYRAPLGDMLVDTISREQVRGLVKKVMVRMPRGSGRARPPPRRKGGGAERLGVLRKMINWGMRERLLKRSDNPATGMEDNLPKKDRRNACSRSRKQGSPGEPRRHWVTRSGRSIS